MLPKAKNNTFLPTLVLTFTLMGTTWWYWAQVAGNWEGFSPSATARDQGSAVYKLKSNALADSPSAKDSEIDLTFAEYDLNAIYKYVASRVDNQELAWTIAKTVIQESSRYGLDPKLTVAVIEVESSFQPDAISPAGARGLMQVMPETGRTVALWLGMKDFQVSDLYHPVTNIEIGVRFLAELWRKYKDWDAVLTAYNRGEPSMLRLVEDKGSARTSYGRAVIQAKKGLEPPGSK